MCVRAVIFDYRFMVGVDFFKLLFSEHTQRYTMVFRYYRMFGLIQVKCHTVRIAIIRAV